MTDAEGARARQSRFGSFSTGLVLIGAVAIAARVLYVLVIARAPIGVGGDAGFYHSAANLIADGRFYYRGIFGHAFLTAEHPPLFALILSVSSLLGGDTLLAHRIVGCALGSCGVVVIGLLARRVSGERAGLFAALIAALYPPLITADGLVMSEPLFVLLLAIALLLALNLRSRPTLRGAALLGIFIGLATLTRGEGIALLVLLAVSGAYGTGPGRRARLVAGTAAALLVIAPWVARNLIVFHRVMLAADANTLVAGANCRQAYYGNDIGWWRLDCLAHGRTRAQLLAGDASTGPALRYAGEHLARATLVAAVRILRTFDLFQPLRQGNRELRRRWVDIVGLLFYYPLLLLAGCGLWRLRDGRWVLMSSVWMVVIVSALGWGIGRFRVGADVSLIVLAAAFLAPRSASGALAPGARAL